MINSIWAISKNTFKEVTRSRVLNIILVVAVLLVVAISLASSISLDQDAKIIKELGLTIIFLLSTLIAIYVGTNLIYQELARKTIYQILTKPVGRSEFVVGKFIGLGLVMLMIIGLLGIVLMGLIKFNHQPWDWLILEALALNYVEILIVISLSIMFSAFTSPLASAIYTLAIFLIGHSASTLKYIIDTNHQIFIQWPLTAFYYVINFEKFNIRNGVVYGLGLNGIESFWAILYAIFFMALMLSLAIKIFEAQEF